jgi:integrase
MSRRKRLTDDGVANLQPRSARYAFPDPELPGHYVRVQPSGGKSFVVVVKGRDGRQRWITVGSVPVYNIDLARKRAAEVIRAVREGKGEPDDFESVAAKWRKLHCEARQLRSLSEIDRHLGRMSRAWTGRTFASIGRGDVSKLLDKMETENGPRQATYALQVFSAMANWYAARDDNYRSPLVKGMRRGKPTKRDRVLDDDELRAIWKQAEANGTFGAFVRVAVLTAQRREKVAAMKWTDIEGGVWTIATEAREKGNAGELGLPKQALAIIEAQPRYASNPYVFAGRGGGHIAGWSKLKREFDAKLKGVEPWTVHDLRRTARSLMSRAGVQSHIAERVLGHAIQGVEGVYDRHQYREEKAHALKALAGLILNIVDPADNVLALRGKSA